MALILPLGVIACSNAKPSRSKTDASAPTDACAPELQTVFFGTIDGAPECRATQHLACGLPASVHEHDAGCGIRASDCRAVCPSYGAFNCQAADASCVGGHIARDGPISVSCDFCPGGIGRRPAGLVMPEAGSIDGALAAYFERAAFLEAASVRAFEELREALIILGAPQALHDAARRAASDEISHFKLTARLARRFGGRAPPIVRLSRAGAPNLDALARDNAVEGCVRETYGALVALHQSRAARDGVVRGTMEIVATDETRHAALSWAVFHWAATRLGRTARAAMRAALGEAIAKLYSEVREPDVELVRTAGLPTSVEQKRLLRQLEMSIWS